MDKTFDFSYFPVLETERCRLRQITRDDAPAILAIFSDPEVMRHLDDDPPCNTLEQAASIIDWMHSWFQEKSGLRWGITLHGDNLVIGTCGFHLLSHKHHRTDIGYDLASAYWGKGYITEVTRAMVRWCFENLNLHRIQADCNEDNFGSARVLEKAGFTFEGLWRENIFEKGRFVSLKQYGLLRRECLGDKAE